MIGYPLDWKMMNGARIQLSFMTFPPVCKRARLLYKQKAFQWRFPLKRVGQTGSLPGFLERPYWREQGKLPVRLILPKDRIEGSKAICQGAQASMPARFPAMTD
jgi:hypothetical protein